VLRVVINCTLQSLDDDGVSAPFKLSTGVVTTMLGYTAEELERQIKDCGYDDNLIRITCDTWKEKLNNTTWEFVVWLKRGYMALAARKVLPTTPTAPHTRVTAFRQTSRTYKSGQWHAKLR